MSEALLSNITNTISHSFEVCITFSVITHQTHIVSPYFGYELLANT